MKKRNILREYEAYKYVEQMGKEWVHIIQATEVARAEYRKHRSIENADKLLFAVDGCGYGK